MVHSCSDSSSLSSDFGEVDGGTSLHP
jgi:hypothetical protein